MNSNFVALSSRQIGIDEFINKFKLYDTEDRVLIKTFTLGFCYYFSVMLNERYKSGEIMYLAIENHFVYKYQDKLWDIRGDVTNLYSGCSDLYMWDTYPERESVIKWSVKQDEPCR